MISAPNSPPRLRDFVEGAVMVAASTLAGLAMSQRWGTSAVDLLYLPAVLAAAILSGLRPALFAALASALAYNYFFTAPLGTFQVDDPADLVTVVVLFLVAVVASQLAASVRRQARLAGAHASRNATIAGFAQRLLSCTSEKEIAGVTTVQLAELFASNVLLVKAGAEPIIVESAPGPAHLTPGDLAAAQLTLQTGRPAGRGVARLATAEWQFHALRREAPATMAVGLARDDGALAVGTNQTALLDNLLDQVSLALERARLESEARDFSAVRERDRIRSVLLATIGEDVRPRVSSIIDIASKLQRTIGEERALVASIRSEAKMLERYVSNLVDLGVEDGQQPVASGDVSIDLFQRTVRRAGRDAHLTPKEYAVLAELAKHPGRVLTHAHLLRTAWGPAHEKQIEYLRIAVRGIRQKLEPNPSRPTLILNEPAVGYRLSC